MKSSFFSMGNYRDAALLSTRWPAPPALYKPKVGTRALQRKLDECVLADELGFDWVSFSEHHYLPTLLEGNPITVAAAASQVVKRAKLALLGPIVAFNNPIRIAEEIALLDNLSGGRAVMLFLRSGGFEFATYTSNLEESRERTQEATQLILHALTEPQPFGWEGKHFRYRTVAVWPQTVQRPHPPLYYSGNSFESAAFAARNRLGLACSFFPTEYLETIIDHYKSEAAQAGWHPTREHILYRGICTIAETDAEAAEIASPLLTSPLPGGDEGIVGQAFGRLQWQGDPETVFSQCRELHDIGIGVIDLAFVGGFDEALVPNQMRLFAEEVMPRIRAFDEIVADDEPMATAALASGGTQ